MLPIPVIASPVTHLTDARYFAAWLVDGVVYPLDGPMAIRPQKVLQIREWLEGPSSMARFEGTESKDIPEQLAALEIDTVVLAGQQYLQDAATSALGPVFLELSATCLDLPVWAEEKKVEGVFFYLSHDQEQNQQFVDLWSEQEVPLYIIYQGQSNEDLIRWIREGKVSGLVVQGGEEEKVGYKSFDQLDDLYDFLLDSWN
jgi:phosphoribosylanthranilate isomerase